MKIFLKLLWQQWEMQVNNMQENLQPLVVQQERVSLNKKKLCRKIYEDYLHESFTEFKDKLEEET